MDLLEKKIAEIEVRHPWETARFAVLIDLLSKYKKEAREGSIIDIGCGDAFVVNSLAQEFPNTNIVGVDTAYTENDFEEFYSTNTFTNLSIKTNINDLDSSEKADYVLLMDVIEHIDNDVDFLKMIHSANFIDKQTTFIITVPAFNSLFSAHDSLLKHYRRYSRKALVDTVKNSGFEILESNYFFTSLLLIRILQKFKEMIFGETEQKGLHHEEFSKKSAGLMKNILLLDYRILKILTRIGIKIPGLSTYVICRIS